MYIVTCPGQTKTQHFRLRMAVIRCNHLVDLGKTEITVTDVKRKRSVQVGDLRGPQITTSAVMERLEGNL